MALSQVGLERLNTATTKKIGTSKNLIINGAMQVAQRGTVTGITTSQYAGPDRFRFGIASHGTFTVSQNSSAPTGSGFASSLKLDCTTADTSVASGTAVYFQHKLEGKDCQRIKKGTSSAEQLAVQFHVKSNKTGTYAFQLSDNDNSRSFTTTYSISSADTWEKKTIIIPADTTGALDNDNNVSLTFNFWLVAGTDFTSGAASTTWYSHVNANAAKGHAVNIADSTSNEWYMTGFQVETGSVHTDFEHRSFGDELLMCQRYFQIVRAASITASSTTFTRFNCPLHCKTRTVAPSVGKFGSQPINIGDMVSQGSQSTNSPSSDGYSGDDLMMSCSLDGFSGLTQYRTYCHELTATQQGLVAVDAEL